MDRVRMRQAWRRAAGIGARTIGVLLILAIVVQGLLRIDRISTGVVNALADRLDPFPATRLSVERVEVSWIGNLRLRGVRLTPDASAPNAGPDLSVASFELRVRVLPLFVGRLDIRAASLSGVRAALAQRPDSTWDFLAPFGSSREGGSGGGLRLRSGPLRVDGARIEATFAPGDPGTPPERLEVEDLTLRIASLEVGDGPTRVELDTIHARFLPPGETLDRVTLSGRAALEDGRLSVPGLTLRSGISDVAVRGTLRLPGGTRTETEAIDFRVTAAPLAFRDLSGFVRTLDPGLSLRADVGIRGRTSRVETSGHASLSDGGTVDMEGLFEPGEARLDATVAGVRLQDFLGPGPVGGVVDGRIGFHLAGPERGRLSGDVSVRLDGLRVSDRRALPFALTGRLEDGVADLRIEGGVVGIGSVEGSLGGRPLASPAVILARGTFEQGGTPAGEEGMLESSGVRDLELGFDIEARGDLLSPGSGEARIETRRGTFREWSLAGGSGRLTWDGRRGGFRVDQPLGEGRVLAEGVLQPSGGASAGPGSVLVVDTLRYTGIDLGPVAGVTTNLGGVGRARLEGLDPRQGELRAELQLLPSEIGSVAVDSGTIALSLSAGRMDVTGAVASRAGDLTLRGHALVGGPGPELGVEEATVRGMDLAALSGKAALPSSLNLDAQLSARGPSWHDLASRGEVRLLPSRVRGGTLRGGTLTLESGGGRGTVDGVIETADGRIGLTGVAYLHGRVDSLRVEGDLDVPDLGAFLASGTHEVAARGRTVATWTAGGSLGFVSELQGQGGGATVDTLSVRGSVDRYAFSLDTLQLRSELLQADGSGRLALRKGGEDADRPGLSVAFEVADAISVDSVRVLGRASLGSGTGRITVGGEPGARTADASLDLGRWRARGLSGDSASLRAGYGPGGVALSVTLPGSQRQGPLELVLETTQRPEAKEGVLTRLELSSGSAHWVLVDAVPYAWGDGLRIDGLALASDVGRISVDGTLDPEGEHRLTVRLEQASLSGIGRLAGLEDLRLLVGGELRLERPAASLVAEGSVHFEVGPAADPPAVVDADLSWARGRATLDVQATDPLGGRLSAEGTVPLAVLVRGEGTEADTAGGAAAPSDSIDLHIESRAFDLSWARALVPRGRVMALRGTLSADLKVGGAVRQPVLAGTLAVTDGAVHLAPAGTRYQDVELAASLREDALVLDRLHLASGPGTADVQGRITLESLHPAGIDFSGKLDRFLAWNGATVVASLNGDLSLSGSVDEPRLEGRLDLEGSKVRLDALPEADNAEAVQLTEEDYRMLEDYFGYRVEPEEEREPSDRLARFALDLSARFGQDVWATMGGMNSASLECRGDLHITKEPQGKLRVEGTVETLPERSYFRQFGRRFSVEEGTLTLNGDLSQYSFALDGRWEVPSYSDSDESEIAIDIGVTGSAGRFALTLSSDPSMDESEIIAYLATGHPMTGVATQEAGAAGLGAAMAAGAVAGTLEGLAQERVSLDVAEVAIDPVRGTILVAGRYVSPNLYLGFRQPVSFGEEGNRGRTENHYSEVEVEYRLFNWLTMSLQGSASELRAFFRTHRVY